MVERVIKAADAAAQKTKKRAGVRRKGTKGRPGVVPLAPKRPSQPIPSWIDRVQFELPPAKKVALVEPKVMIDVRGSPGLAWAPSVYHDQALIETDDHLGALESLDAIASPSLTEMVMGLDFGTSCTKVVITDKTSGAAYAVPFNDMAGVLAYLLPSQVSELDGRYVLAQQGRLHTDLKLGMLAGLDDVESNVRVCAFLALVIRAARAWLFSTHRELYKGRELIWSLALGQPADQSTSHQSRQHFERLGRVAWWLAGSDHDLTVHLCADAWSRGGDHDFDAGDVELVVMPELAAQIHGFVTSSTYDARKPNLYLLIDVGAGTLDASLFRTLKDRLGNVTFEFFTNSVEAYGAANLHRHRVSWWQGALESFDGCLQLRQDLERIRLTTEFRSGYPAKFTDYVRNVDVQFEGGAKSPDDSFFAWIREQVVGRVLYAAWKNKLLSQEGLQGTPYFLCGGGAGHPVYQRLGPAIEFTPNCTWLRGTRHELMLPKQLRAPGVRVDDYHRLSVAYGLSKLNFNKAEQVGKMLPRVESTKTSNWHTDYVGKEAC